MLFIRIRLFATPWTAACQASLSFTISPEFAQTYVLWVNDAIQPFHSLSSPSLPDFSLLVYWSARDFCVFNFDPLTTIFIDFYCCSVAQSCLTLCSPMDCSMPGFPVLHSLSEFAQTHIHWVSDVILSSVTPFSSCPQSPPASFQWVGSLHQVTKVLQLQHRSF